MQRENFKSRTGFLLVSAGCGDWHRQCLALSVCYGRKRRRIVRAFYLAFLVLMGIPF